MIVTVTPLTELICTIVASRKVESQQDKVEVEANFSRTYTKSWKDMVGANAKAASLMTTHTVTNTDGTKTIHFLGCKKSVLRIVLL